MKNENRDLKIKFLMNIENPLHCILVVPFYMLINKSINSQITDRHSANTTEWNADVSLQYTEPVGKTIDMYTSMVTTKFEDLNQQSPGDTVAQLEHELKTWQQDLKDEIEYAETYFGFQPI